MGEMGHRPNKYKNHMKRCEYTTDKMGASFILFTLPASFPGSFFPFPHMITCLKEVIEVMKLERKKPKVSARVCVCVCVMMAGSSLCANLQDNKMPSEHCSH